MRVSEEVVETESVSERIDGARKRMKEVANLLISCAHAIQMFVDDAKYKVPPCAASLKLLVDEYRALACELSELYKVSEVNK